MTMKSEICEHWNHSYVLPTTKAVCNESFWLCYLSGLRVLVHVYRACISYPCLLPSLSFQIGLLTSLPWRPSTERSIAKFRAACLPACLPVSQPPASSSRPEHRLPRWDLVSHKFGFLAFGMVGEAWAILDTSISIFDCWLFYGYSYLLLPIYLSTTWLFVARRWAAFVITFELNRLSSASLTHSSCTDGRQNCL
jgi:hypothetical protein